MKLKCAKASASEAMGEIFQVMFEVDPEQEESPYLLIQRAWLEEEEGAASQIYVETHDERLIGHYVSLEAILTRNHLTLRLPPPKDETIEIDFTASARDFHAVQRALGIILQRDLGEED